MATRKRKNHLEYARYTHRAKAKDCEFCAFTVDDEQITKDCGEFWLARNIFPYDVWDASKVEDHLLVVPKRHVDSVAHFSASEQVGFMTILAEYESKGYSVYARAPINHMKSVVHQHTHLIKLEPKDKKFMLYLKKPRVLLTK
jgi:diadenosine tetraphosphate (Ap4A) HIT family hydrolase